MRARAAAAILLVSAALYACGGDDDDDAPPEAGDGAQGEEVAPGVWQRDDGTLFGDCDDVRPYLETLDPEPGFYCE